MLAVRRVLLSEMVLTATWEFLLFHSPLDPNSTPQDSSVHDSRPLHNRSRAPETSHRRVVTAGQQTSRARCRLGSNLSATNVCNLLLNTSPVLQSQLFVFFLSKKNGLWSVQHSGSHDDM